MSLRALETDEPLRRYVEIKAEIQRLTDEMEALKPEITYALMEEPEERTIYAGCEITLSRRRSYEYSAELQAWEKALSDRKRIERLCGTAVVVKDQAFPVVRPLRRDAA